jgi:hypothetical protein
MEPLDLTSADEMSRHRDILARPRTCARCIHWGAQPHEKATDRWQLCLQQPVALANADYWCPAYKGRSRR